MTCSGQVVKEVDFTGVEELLLPRRCKLPVRHDDSLASGHSLGTPKAHYQQVYYEALDNTIGCLNGPFNQPGYKIYCNLEELLIKASLKEDIKEPLQAVCDFYRYDVNRDLLEAQLHTFGVNFQCDTTSSGESIKPTILDIRDHFKALSATQRSLLSQVGRV